MTNRLQQTGPVPETRIPLVHHRSSILSSRVKSESLDGEVIIFLFSHSHDLLTWYSWLLRLASPGLLLPLLQ